MQAILTTVKQSLPPEPEEIMDPVRLARRKKAMKTALKKMNNPAGRKKKHGKQKS